MYLGTGDRDAGDAAGVGAYKSINGGTSWTVANNTMGNSEVNRIIIHPTKTTTILAATSSGISGQEESGTAVTTR